MRNENEKSFAGRLNSTKGYFLGKSKKERDKSGIRPNPYTVYRPSKIPFQLLFIYIIVYTIKSQYHGEEYFSVR